MVTTDSSRQLLGLCNSLHKQYRYLASENKASEPHCRLAGPGEGGQVDVSSGENHAEFGGVAGGTIQKIQGRDFARLQKRRDGHGTGRLNNDFHALPNEARSGNDFVFADQEDAIDIFAENREGARGEGSAQTVGDGVAGI